MAILPILSFPDPRLRTVAAPVERVDDAVRQLITDMYETMYDSGGIGLAATQVDRHLQIVVADVDVTQDRLSASGSLAPGPNARAFINPRITVLDETPFSYEEGCLSVPDFHYEISRPKRVRVDALDELGKPFSIEAEGLLAVCIQHEHDHLQGRLFVDYIPPFQRRRLRAEIEKKQRQNRRKLRAG